MSTQPSDNAEPEAAPAAVSTDAGNENTPTVAGSEPDAAKHAQEEPKVVNPTEPQPTAPVDNEPKPAAAPAQDPDSPADVKDSVSTTAGELPPLVQLWKAAEGHPHFEIWGVPLSDPERHIPTQIIFQKFLNANDGQVEKAKDQLLKTLDWRQKTQPQQLLRKMFSKAKFDGLGYVTTYTAGDAPAVDEPEQKEVFTWNLYGSVKSLDETFGNLQE